MSKAKYYKLIFFPEDPSLGTLEEFNEEYFARNPNISREDFCEMQTYWNKGIGCVGYKILDEQKNLISKVIISNSKF